MHLQRCPPKVAATARELPPLPVELTENEEPVKYECPHAKTTANSCSAVCYLNGYAFTPAD